MGQKKGVPNKKPSKYFIPPDANVNFGNWTFLENVQEVGKQWKYKVRCCCGNVTIQPAYIMVKGLVPHCKKCHMKKMRKARGI